MLLLASGLGLVGQLLFYGKLLGINAVIAAALFLALAWSLRERRIAGVDAWMPAAALLFAAFLAIRTDPAVVTFDALVALGLALASVGAMSGARLTTLPLGRAVHEVGAIAVAGLYRAVPLFARARRERSMLGGRYAGAAAYLGGAALAVPFLAAFALLFSSADAVFARWAEDLLDPQTIREAPGRLALAALVAWITAGTLTLLAREPRATSPTARHRPVRAETATSLLVAIDLLFAVFVALQVAYLFGGRDTIDAAGISYSAYARRGFFELVGAAIVVVGLLFTLDLVAVRTRIVVAAGLALLALTAVVLVSAAYRLDLYQVAYGWSELRLYALAAIVFLGVALAIVGVAIVARRMDQALQPIAMAAFAVALGVNLAAPSAFIAGANLDRATEPQDPSANAALRSDLLYLVSLGDGAVPEIVGRLPALPERERFCLETLLRWRIRGRDLDRPDPWQSWNVDRERARQTLLAIRDELYAPLVLGRDDHAFRPERRIEMRYRAECTAPTTARPDR